MISARGTLIAAAGSNGNVVWSGSAGPWIAHYTYDGLGRLIRKQSPWHELDPWNRPQVRTERFYYDGVRRIQEVVTDPLPMDGVNPVKIEEEMGGVPPLATTSATTREYIHSPGYVDEVVGQVDVPLSPTAADRPAWVIQDANYNVVGLVNDNGDLLHQYTWDPYGQPIAIDRYDTGAAGTAMAPFENRLGHQGLFFDRFDGGVGNVLLPQLWVEVGTGLSAKGLYQNRERTYRPDLGRFQQRDPNGTARTTSAIAKLGQSQPQLVQPLDLSIAYGTGLNIYESLSSNPVIMRDPLGLTPLTELSITETARSGLMAYGHYSQAKAILGMAKSLAQGASAQSILLGLAADLVLSKVGGKAAEKVLGSAGKLGSEIAKNKFKGYAWHHVLPKFLGGSNDGIVTLLPKELHQRFHGDLYRELSRKGYKIAPGKTWDDVLNTDEAKDEAIDILLRVSKTYDDEAGTHLVPAIMEQLVQR